MKKLVKAIQDFPEIKLVGRKLGPFKEGEEVLVRYWEASILEGRGVVEPVEDYSLAGLRKRIMKEEKSDRLEELPSHFYRALALEIKKIRQNGEPEKAKNVKEALDSLKSIRIRKIARMAVSAVKPQNVPPEDLLLLNRFSQALKLWRRRLDRLLEETQNEEVGTHERELRRSIQGVVRDTADIQG